MFKIGKIKQIQDEKLKIEKTGYRHGRYIDGKTEYEKVEVLSFKIENDNYSFSFMLNCKLNKLLELPMNESIDFQKYLFMDEVILKVNGTRSYCNLEMNIKIYRYFENKYEISLCFYTEESDDDYTGLIRFEFDLDDYL